jgi:hypothetical protein
MEASSSPYRITGARNSQTNRPGVIDLIYWQQKARDNDDQI